MIALLAGPAWAATAGSIQVTASAPGELLLDGFPTGLTAPATLEGVAPGPHEVAMEWGCLIGEVEVEVEREKTTTIELSLEDRGGSGTLQVVGLPPGAELSLDGQPIEPTQSVACGPHTILVEAPGFETWEAEVVITTDLLERVEPALAEAALMDEPMTFGGSEVDEDDFAFDDDPLLAEEDGEIPDFDLSAAEQARRDEEERRRKEAERRRLAEAERQARLAAYGVDEDLDADEEEDEGRGRNWGRDEDEGSVLAALDDDLDFAEDAEDEDDEEGIYIGGVTYDELDDEDDRRSREPRDEAERDPLPVKWIVVGASGAVGVTGIALGAVGASRRAEAQAAYDEVIANTNDTSNEAAVLIEQNDLNPATRLMTGGFVLGGVGLAGAAGAAIAMEVSATHTVLHLSGRW